MSAMPVQDQVFNVRCRVATQIANSGGPSSRRRTEHVVASVLRDRDTDSFHLPRALRAGLIFGERDPLQVVLESLARAGLDDAEQLRERFPPPPVPLLARAIPDAHWGVRVARGSDDAILQQALLLGLCTAFQYDPSRPVLWTRASLTRRVELYEPGSFYA